MPDHYLSKTCASTATPEDQAGRTRPYPPAHQRQGGTPHYTRCHGN